MLDDDTPGLGVDFVIDAGDSFGELARLSAVMESTEAKVLADANRIEKATKNMIDVAGSTISMQTFGAVATRELAATARELGRVEKSGEAMIRSLDRQASTFGKTREEIRATKAETAALAAEQQGLTELAGRIRSAEAAIFEQELAAARAARFEAEAATQAKETAAAQAIAAAEREAQALREASLAYQLFEARVRDGARALREQEAAQKAADRDGAAAKLQADAQAASKAADEHVRLASIVRGSQAAQEADAAAAERLRVSTDPLYATTKRLNAALEESTRLYHSGATAKIEYERQQGVLRGQLEAETAALGGATRAHGEHNAAIGLARNSQMELIHVLKSSFDQMAAGAPISQVLFQHVAQIGQAASMTEGGFKGMALGLGSLLAGVAPLLVPLTIVAGAAFAAFKQFQGQVKDSGELTHYRDSLGLTHKEMLQLSDGVDKAGGKIKALSDVTVTAGDVMAGLWKTIAGGVDTGGAWDSIKSGAAKAFGYVLEAWNAVSAGITAGIYGTFNAVKLVWGSFPAVFGDLFVQGVNAAIAALNSLVKAGVGQLNSLIAVANSVPGVKIGQISAPEIGPIDNANAGAAAKAAKQIGASYTSAYADARKADAAFWKQVGSNAVQHAKDRMSAEADALKENRTPKKPKIDHHAEELARDAAATEAQIKNLYALADAYKVSGAAALIAEARVKAESQAIKQRGDIEAAIDRQVRLAIATRVSDAAKATAGQREQANAQTAVNAAVAGGLVPAERAAELVKNRIADLPLLAAIEAAQQRGLKTEADRATQALADQRAERNRLTASERAAQFNADIASGANRLAEMREELRLVGATDMARVQALATIRATQEALTKGYDSAQSAAYIAQQVEIARQQQVVSEATEAWNASLGYTADLFDAINASAQSAASGMSDAFGKVGSAIGSTLSVMTSYYAQQARLQQDHAAALRKAGTNQAAIDHENQLNALRTATLQVGAYGDMAAAAKGFFKEGSSGYKALATAEKAFRLIQFALSARAIATDAVETGTKLANSAARTAAGATEAVVNAIKSLPFPLNLAAGAATIAALASIGVSIAGAFGGGGKNTLPKANDGTGTVLGDASAKSESITRAIESLHDVDTVTSVYAREMAGSLRSIESQIGNLASVLVRSGDIDGTAGVTEGFKTNAIGSVLKAVVPLFGGLLSSLFGSKTTVVGGGIYGGAQTVGSIVNNGFDASTYSDVEKKKKFFGITTGTSYSTKYGAADAGVESQFTLILKEFNSSIAAAAGPLGESTAAIQSRLNGFVIDIGKIDLKGLTADQISDKLNAVFGAAADKMAEAAFPGIERFQKVGEGAYETLVRVASMVEAVTSALGELGSSTVSLGIDAKMGLAAQFDSVGDLSSAVDGYFQAFYTKDEQTAAHLQQMTSAFAGLGLTMPDTLAGFRALVDAQDLTTAAGQKTYAALLQLSPAFADLQSALNGAKSAADVASERQDLERQLLELQGNTAAIRALDLAKLDASNRTLQQQIYAVQDAQDAAKAAEDLRQAWQSVGDSIMDEVKRIRGLTNAGGGNSFADLLSQFNAANTAARGGDQDAAKGLPALSQALLTAAADAATSRQELDRVQAQTAAALEATYGVIGALTTAAPASTTAQVTAAAESQGGTTTAANDDGLLEEVRGLRQDVADLRRDNNSGHAATAGNTGRIDRKLEDVTAASGGAAISVTSAAA